MSRLLSAWYLLGASAVAHLAQPRDASCQCGVASQSRIVGGSDASAGQFPWQAGLMVTGTHRPFCGGSLINDRFVLTAAHCTAGSTASQIQVKLGDLRTDAPDAGEQRFSVARIIDHPQYSSPPWVSGWDFSLLELNRIVTFSSTVSTVCLPRVNETYAGATATASGYGRLGATAPQPTTLQFVQMPVWNQSRCAEIFNRPDGSLTLKSVMLCAGGEEKAICMGDSGGPLVNEVSGRFELIGLSSFAVPCALPGMPDFYMRITEALDWINANTAGAQYCKG